MDFCNFIVFGLSLIHISEPTRHSLFLAGAVFAALLILVAIEAHQDKVLNDIALRENNELEKKYEIG